MEEGFFEMVDIGLKFPVVCECLQKHEKYFKSKPNHYRFHIEDLSFLFFIWLDDACACDLDPAKFQHIENIKMIFTTRFSKVFVDERQHHRNLVLIIPECIKKGVLIT